MDKMKVLQVNKLYYPESGGIERTVQNLAEGLRSHTDMEVLVCQKKGKGSAERINGVKVCRSSSFGVLFSLPISLAFLRDFRRLSRDRDIVHIHVPFPLGDLACLLSGYKGKVVVYWHSDVVKQKKLLLLYRPLMEWLLKRADLILVGAEGIIEGSYYLKPYREKCKVVPFAVSEEIRQDGQEYLSETIKERSADGQAGHASGTSDPDQVIGNPRIRRPLRFLFVGRLVYYKGCEVLLKAMAQVHNADLTILGTGELEESLKALSRRLGLEDKVHFCGQVTDEEMKSHFRDTDVLVFPSLYRSEAFGLVQLEAMAYGKPVINTDLPSGVPWVSLHGETGLTVEPGCVQALAEAMDWMVNHPDERIQYGRAAKERLDQNFTLDKVLPQVYSAYKAALNR